MCKVHTWLSLRAGGQGFPPGNKKVNPPGCFHEKIEEKWNQKKSLAVWFPTYLLYLPSNLKSWQQLWSLLQWTHFPSLLAFYCNLFWWLTKEMPKSIFLLIWVSKPALFLKKHLKTLICYLQGCDWMLHQMLKSGRRKWIKQVGKFCWNKLIFNFILLKVQNYTMSVM